MLHKADALRVETQQRNPVDLSYEEFLEFTTIHSCHYCGAAIAWEAFSTASGTYTSRAYHLDRKDNAQGYSKDNCVVCCTACNIVRANRFTYDEFMLLAPGLTQITARRIRRPNG